MGASVYHTHAGVNGMVRDAQNGISICVLLGQYNIENHPFSFLTDGGGVRHHISTYRHSTLYEQISIYCCRRIIHPKRFTHNLPIAHRGAGRRYILPRVKIDESHYDRRGIVRNPE